jgi:hypothetical protein
MVLDRRPMVPKQMAALNARQRFSSILPSKAHIAADWEILGKGLFRVWTLPTIGMLCHPLESRAGSRIHPPMSVESDRLERGSGIYIRDPAENRKKWKRHFRTPSL